MYYRVVQVLLCSGSTYDTLVPSFSGWVVGFWPSSQPHFVLMARDKNTAFFCCSLTREWSLRQDRPLVLAPQHHLLTDCQHRQHGPVGHEAGENGAPHADEGGPIGGCGLGSDLAPVAAVGGVHVGQDGGEEQHAGDHVQQHQVDHEPGTRKDKCGSPSRLQSSECMRKPQMGPCTVIQWYQTDGTCCHSRCLLPLET